MKTKIYFKTLIFIMLLSPIGLLANSMAGGLTETAKIDRVFPNPFVNSFSVEFDGEIAQEATISVFDVIGNRIFIQELPNLPRGEFRVDLSDQSLEKGVYFLRVEIGDEVITHRLLKD